MYDRDDASHGEALQAMASLQSSVQTGIAADKKTGEINGDGDFVAGAGAQARKAANTNIGMGETFGAMTDNQQIGLMAKEKKNASTGFVGGIESQYAEIMEHNDGKDAIKDMVTAAQNKGIQSSGDAKMLREKYDTDHDGNIDDASALYSDTQKAKAKASAVKDQAELDMLENGGDDLSKEQKARVADLKQSIQADEAIANNTQSMGLKEQAELLSKQKLDSQLGQALGVKENINNAGVNYAQNAMYGDESQQQSTKAKLDAQGGVEGAVKVDTTDAQIKAKTQQDVLDAQLKEGGAKDGLLTKSADDLSRAADKLAQTAGTMAGGKTASDIKTVDTANEKFNNGGYIGMQRDRAEISTSGDVKKLELSEDQNMAQDRAEAYIKGKVGELREKKQRS
ncbi:hypothetical protein JHD46_05235 [Sulfurimonas sp. SAG-AH-194-C20]|nr:hypothetical protein [Sulfurimonas sp. SAG-AH-194-C20]MDF1879042.1 hypothetical protein [Sulfurimonas sp. SAG-AH-194-C20]